MVQTCTLNSFNFPSVRSWVGSNAHILIVGMGVLYHTTSTALPHPSHLDLV